MAEIFSRDELNQWNSIATSSLVASIMNAKYVNGMPLDRIATDFRRNGVNICSVMPMPAGILPKH